MAIGTIGPLKTTLSTCTQNVKATAYDMLVPHQYEYVCQGWNLLLKIYYEDNNGYF